MTVPVATLGPYRLERRLGAGGMGEVYCAYDSRLERRVAIKVIRSEALASAAARERFRREARAAAGLSHPSIVQIHDILETPGGDSIVMELVDGETLAARLKRGLPNAAEVVRLGREIASGLAAAHAQEIVHRDLKTDNVMLTRDGRVKILDFGIAKRLAPGEADTTLTADYQVLGTLHSMSPEQAQGFDVDPRSDLFSLGTILYEATTGRPPFRSPTAAETLTKILTFRPPPAKESRPELPEGLSRLIDRLLEKDPVLRPASAAEVVSLLDFLDERSNGEPTIIEAGQSQPSPLRRRRWPWIAAAAVALAATIGTTLALLPRQAAPLHVAVLRPEVSTADATVDPELVAAAVRVALLQGLQDLAGVSPLALDQVDAAAGTSADVARELAADEIVQSRLDCSRQGCRAALSRIRGGDSGVPWTASFEVPADDLLLLSTAVSSQLRAGYPDRGLRRGARDLEVEHADYERYLRLRRSFQLRDESTPLEQLLDQLTAIEESSPRFVPARLLEAQIAHHRFESTREPADLERAVAAVDRARELAPSDPQVLFLAFTLALAGQELDQAEAILDELARVQPGDANVTAQRALLAERRGDAKQALQLMRTATARHPSWQNLFNLGNLEYRQGEVAAARSHLLESLDRSPGSFRSQSSLAQLELVSGDLDRAVALYRELVARSNGLRELSNLGVAYMLARRNQEAADCFRRVLERAPESVGATLNLADAEVLLGQADEAKAHYRRVLELTGSPAAQGKYLTVRAQALAHLGRSREAAAAAQEATRTQPRNPGVAFEAALVYTLIGDRSSALAGIDQALTLGTEPRWFSLPWFDSLRSDPEFPVGSR